VGVRNRLEKLEAAERLRDVREQPTQLSWAMEKLLRMHENHRRAERDLETLPLVRTPEEAALDVAHLEHTLAVTIPSYRQGRGYQSGEGREFLDRWEQETREKLEKGDPNG
jgi:hypothetical protein